MNSIPEILFKFLDFCCLCGDEFHKKSDHISAIKMHLNKHLDESPFECFYCAELYEDMEMFLNHYLKHLKNTAIADNKQSYVEESLSIGSDRDDDELSIIETEQNCLDTQTSGNAKRFKRSPIVETENISKFENHVEETIQKTSATITKSKRKNVFSTTELQSHQRQTGISHECATCHKTFNNPESFRKHVQIHTGEKPHQCTVCGHCFRVQSNLKSHMRTHSGERPHKCNVCSKSFTRATHLNEHTNIHKGVKPFSCTECDKSFTNSATMRKHFKIHSGVKPLECSLCPKRFFERSDLNKHLRTHTLEHPFVCLSCGATFTRQDSLKKHLRNKTDCGLQFSDERK